MPIRIARDGLLTRLSVSDNRSIIAYRHSSWQTKTRHRRSEGGDLNLPTSAHRGWGVKTVPLYHDIAGCTTSLPDHDGAFIAVPVPFSTERLPWLSGACLVAPGDLSAVCDLASSVFHTAPTMLPDYHSPSQAVAHSNRSFKSSSLYRSGSSASQSNAPLAWPDRIVRRRSAR